MYSHGDLVHRESAEVPQFHNSTLQRIEIVELVQGGIQVQQVDVRGRRMPSHVWRRDLKRAAATLQPASGPRMIHQDPSDDAGRHREEVRPVLPVLIRFEICSRSCWRSCSK